MEGREEKNGGLVFVNGGDDCFGGGVLLVYFDEFVNFVDVV